MGLKIFAILLLLCSIAYAEISPIAIDEISNHGKLANKLNQIIYAINQQNRTSEQKVSRIDSQFTLLKTELEDTHVIVKPVHIAVAPEGIKGIIND